MESRSLISDVPLLFRNEPHEKTLINLNKKDEDRPKHVIDLAKFLSKDGLRYDKIKFSQNSLNPIHIWSNLVKLKNSKEITVLFSPSWQILLGFLFGLKKAPIVMVCWRVRYNNLIKSTLFRFLCFVCDNIFTNDPVLLGQLKNQKLCALSKCKYLPLPVDTDYYVPSRNPRRNYLLVVGDAARNEDLVIKLSLVSKIPIIRMTRESKVKDIYAKLNKDSVIFKFRLSYLEALWHIQNAYCVLLPLTDGNQPAGLTTLLEAMACKTPCLITGGPAARAVNQDQINCIELEAEPQISKLIKEIENTDKLRYTAKSAYEYVQNCHSFEYCLSVWKEYMSKL